MVLDCALTVVQRVRSSAESDVYNGQLFGAFALPVGIYEWLLNLGTCWLYVGLGGLLFRTVHLFFIRDVPTGLVWAIKIMTDPFHDAKLYYKAPLYLMRGELIDRDIGKHVF